MERYKRNLHELLDALEEWELSLRPISSRPPGESDILRDFPDQG